MSGLLSGAHPRANALLHTVIVPQNKLQVAQSEDLPDVLIHLTARRGRPSPALAPDIAALLPWNRLAGILHHQSLRYSRPFDTAWPVASFTQTTRRALYALGHYQHTGIAFHKQFVWDAGGGPVHYVRGDKWSEWVRSDLSEQMKSMGVRLWPGWVGPPPASATGFFADSDETRGRSEWLHEREWRLPRPNDADWGWAFPREAVAFLVCLSPRLRAMTLDTLSAWEGDRVWAESLPVVYPDPDSKTFFGEETIWA